MRRRLGSAATGAVIVSMALTAVAHAGSDTLKGRDWGLRHLGPSGLEKCSAFRKVRTHTARLQASGGGAITASQRHRLEFELRTANNMPPKGLTPSQCGVPL